MKTLYEFAQDAMALGFNIFPLPPRSKKPDGGVTPHGFKDSSADPAVIAAWWKRNPEFNFGINCGDSGIAVSDIDAGLNSLEEFEAWFVASGLPQTYTVRTGRRNAFGVHMYWKGTMPSSGSKKWSLNGCTGEIKSVGGYVVGVGSIHPDSGERWEVICDAPLAELPNLVRDSVTRAAAATPVVAASSTDGKIPPGTWHNLLVSFAGKMFNAGITSPKGLYRAMVAYAEDNFDFSQVPLDKNHVAQIAENVAASFEKAADTSVSEDWVKPEEITGAADAAEVVEERTAMLESWDKVQEELFEIRLGLDQVVNAKGETKFVKKPRIQVDNEIMAYVYQALKNMRARFFVDAYPHIFLPAETVVYKFYDDDDVFRIMNKFGLKLTQNDYDLVKENLHQQILMYGEKTNIEKFGRLQGEAIYVNNGRNGMFRITVDKFEEVPNGTDEVFMINKHFVPWPRLDLARMAEIASRLGGKGGKVSEGCLCEFLDGYFEEGELTGEQYQQLVLLRYLSLFLNGAVTLHPIMMATGVQNSGKSTLWEKFLWLFYGTGIKSGGLPTNLRSFIAAVTNHQIQLFDNIDRAGFDNQHSDYPAYIDIMCKCSTGGQLEIAQLYKNNVEKVYQLRCDIFMTARVIPFPTSASDLQRRMLRFPIRVPDHFKSSETLKREFDLVKDDAKLETLVRLQLVLRALLASSDKEYQPSSEMGDYENFTRRIAEYEGWGNEMAQIWKAHQGEHKTQLAEDSPLVNFLRCWLGRPGNAGRWVRVGQIYRELSDRYQREFTQIFRTDAVFGRRIKENISALAILGVEKKFLDGSTTYRFLCSPHLTPEETAIQVGQCQNAFTDTAHRWSLCDDFDPDPGDPKIPDMPVL